MYISYRVRVLVEEAPLVEDHEDEPSKDTHQEQHLRHKLKRNVTELLKVSKKLIQNIELN